MLVHDSWIRRAVSAAASFLIVNTILMGVIGVAMEQWPLKFTASVGRILPASSRAVHAAFLSGQPILMAVSPSAVHRALLSPQSITVSMGAPAAGLIAGALVLVMLACNAASSVLTASR
jgi:hypothetical protein